MPNAGQPTISLGATGGAVRWLQRALRRTANLGLVVDGNFGPVTETAVKEFQQGAGLAVDGVVGPLTWAALPNGAPMPTLSEGSTGAVVRSLQQVLSNGASGQRTRRQVNRRQFRPKYESVGSGVSNMGGVAAMALLVIKRGPFVACGEPKLETAVGLQTRPNERSISHLQYHISSEPPFPAGPAANSPDVRAGRGRPRGEPSQFNDATPVYVCSSFSATPAAWQLAAIGRASSRVSILWTTARPEH